MGKIPKAENGFSPPSSGKPSGEDWEALIVCATKKVNNDSSWNSGSEWQRIEKFWTDYEVPAMKLGVEFAKTYGSNMEQWGSKGDMTTASRWRGKNKTPKTDIMANKNKISLKKSGGSQLMSAGQDEAVSTFEAAMETFSQTNRRQVLQMIDDIQNERTEVQDMYEKVDNIIKNVQFLREMPIPDSAMEAFERILKTKRDKDPNFQASMIKINDFSGNARALIQKSGINNLKERYKNNSPHKAKESQTTTQPIPTSEAKSKRENSDAKNQPSSKKQK